jgi:hypothetical protein
MKIFIIMMFISSVWANKADMVFNQLKSIHGAHWQPVIKQGVTVQDIKMTLKNIVLDDDYINQFDFTYKLKDNYRQRAMIEFGHFAASTQSSRLAEDDLEVYEYYISSEAHLSSKNKIAFFESLKNTGSLQAYQWITSHLYHENNISVLLRMVGQLDAMINNDSWTKKPIGDIKFVKKMNINKKNRLQANRKAWIKAIQLSLHEFEDIKERFTNYLNASEIHHFIDEKSHSIEKKLTQLSAEPNHSETIIKKQEQSEGKTQRSQASTTTKSKKPNKNTFLIWMLVILLATSFSKIYFYTKKKF